MGRRGGLCCRCWNRVQSGGPSIPPFGRDEGLSDSERAEEESKGSMADEAIVCISEQIYSGSGAMSTTRESFVLSVGYCGQRKNPAEAGAD